MPQITIENMQGKTIDCPDQNERVLDILLRHLDWMHACGGKGRCTTCSLIITQGHQGASSPSQAEVRYSELGRLEEDERLACQFCIKDNIAIYVPVRNQLPHQNYSS